MNVKDSSMIMSMRSQLLEQNGALRRAAGLGEIGAGPAGANENGGSGFADTMRKALAEVNELQASSAAATDAYERGESADIASVMLARQQASIGFEATLQVRNKLLSAYKDMMSMPV